MYNGAQLPVAWLFQCSRTSGLLTSIFVMATSIRMGVSGVGRIQRIAHESHEIAASRVRQLLGVDAGADRVCPAEGSQPGRLFRFVEVGDAIDVLSLPNV
jgi:hypothetical protein